MDLRIIKREKGTSNPPCRIRDAVAAYVRGDREAASVNEVESITFPDASAGAEEGERVLDRRLDEIVFIGTGALLTGETKL